MEIPSQDNTSSNPLADHVRKMQAEVEARIAAKRSPAPQPEVPAETPTDRVQQIADKVQKSLEKPQVVEDQAPVTTEEVTPPSEERKVNEDETVQKGDGPEDGSEEAGQEGEEGSKEVNFKKIRTVLGETKKALREKETLLTELQAKVQKYETGEELPAPLKERLPQLEKAERIVSLKTSPAYKALVVEPRAQNRAKLLQMAEAYSIPPELLEQAVGLQNVAQLNRFLSDHFDDVGAREVKELITEAQRIEETARAQEAEPEKALQTLEQEHQRLTAARKSESLKELATTSETSFQDAYTDIVKEGKALELIQRAGNDEHNTKIVKPILETAGQQYGALVKELAANGLEKLSPAVAKTLAKWCMLSFAAATALETRAAAVNHINTLEENTRRSTRYLRPSLSSNNGIKPSATGERVSRTPQEVGRAIAQQVVGRR